MGDPKVTQRGPAAPPTAGPSAAGNGGGEPIGDGHGPARLSPPEYRSNAATAVLARPVSVPAAGPAARLSLVPTRRRVPCVTVEGALYALLLTLAVLTRFWDLNSRALHHDESLHAYFSWTYATGEQYVHDPLMHGPFLFHANALVYLLLGASDATSRSMPALFGVALVGLPYLLRGPRHLGRWGALAASFLFLISPALLYQSRYIRHDIFTVVGSLALFIGIVRYLERPERRWLVMTGASLGFLLTNHEIVFGIAAIFAGVLWGALLWGRLRPLVPLHLVVIPAALALWLYLPDALDRPLPAIPWRSPTRDQQLDFYRDLLTHPLTIALVLLLVVSVAAALRILARRRDPERAHDGWVESLFAGAPRGSVEAAVRNAWADRSGLSLTLAVGALIFAVLYTSLFTNLYGLSTGTVATDGTLLYWLGQHHFRRGEQPWFYYLLLFPQYEFFAVHFGGAATLLTGITAVRAALGRVVPGPRFFFRLFLAVWFVGIFAALSWAGEKMPWLVIHITLPATLLAAALLGELAERWSARTRPAAARAGLNGAEPVAAAPRRRWVEPALAVALLVAAGSWFFLAGRLTYGTFVEDPTPNSGGWSRDVTSFAADRWWWLALPPLAALGLLGLGWLVRGPRRTGRAALAALVIGLALLQVHAAWRTVYLEGDVPKDMLIYTQTSPDITRMVDELSQLSFELTGGKGLEIWYDDNRGVSWPMQWYLRDFPNRRLFGGSLTGPPDDTPVLIVGHDNRGGVEPFMVGYTAQEYVLRWWFPEHPIYRNFAIAPELDPGDSAWKSNDQPHDLPAVLASVRDSVATLLEPEGQQRLYRLLMYRDLPARIDSYKYTLYIRNDLLPLFNTIRY